MFTIKSIFLPSMLIAAIGMSVTALAADRPSFVTSSDLTICIAPTFPPMEFMEKAGDEDPSGFDVDLARALAKYWNVNVKFARMDFNGLLPSLEADRCGAVISGVTLQPDRVKNFNAVPYLDTKIVVAAKAGTDQISDISALSNKTIAVESGTTYVGRLEEINDQLKAKGLAPVKIQQYPKQSDAIQQLLIGRADGVVTQDTEIVYRELQSPGTLAMVFRLPQTSFEPFAIYMKPDDANKAAVTEAIKALKADGTLSKIVDDWKLSQDQLTDIGN